MLDVEVLYIEKNSGSTNIVKIQEKLIVNETINKIINKTCLKFLTTLDGRIEAIKQVYKISKFVPVYISDGLILQPIYSTA